MSAYIKSLMAQVEASAAEREQRVHSDTARATERLTPLDERLRRLLSTIPLELQQQGLALDALRTALRGRWRGNCHPGELGAALRRLGFMRVRRWRAGDGFRAVWAKK